MHLNKRTQSATKSHCNETRRHERHVTLEFTHMVSRESNVGHPRHLPCVQAEPNSWMFILHTTINSSKYKSNYSQPLISTLSESCRFMSFGPICLRLVSFVLKSGQLSGTNIKINIFKNYFSEFLKFGTICVKVLEKLGYWSQWSGDGFSMSVGCPTIP